jgi:hypothetical protein
MYHSLQYLRYTNVIVKIALVFFVLLLTLTFSMPVTQANTGTGTVSTGSSTGTGTVSTGSSTGTGTVSTGSSTGTGTVNTTPAARLQNPLAGTIDSLPDLVKELLNIVLIIGTPIVALAIIFAGFMLVAAQGNPEKLQKARSALLWAIVGGAVLLGSYILAQAIGGSVNELIAP